MEQTVSKDVLDAFAYGFFVMCLVSAVFVAARMRLMNGHLTLRERISAHVVCIATAALIAAYFVGLGIVTKEIPTLYLGILLPAAFALFDIHAVASLRVLKDAATPEDKEIEEQVARFRD